LKLNHSILFSFYPNKDYNSGIIKIFLFFFFISAELAVNCLFFGDETMHQIYEDQGSFNFIYQIPQILYSSILSFVLESFIKYFSLTGDAILGLKEKIRNNSKDFNIRIKKLFLILKIKFVLFFIISFILLLFFWFYITCFCGIYRNTQIHLIKDSLISLLMSFIYPFGSFLFIATLRMIALRTNKKNRKYLYNFSQFLENIL